MQLGARCVVLGHEIVLIEANSINRIILCPAVDVVLRSLH